MKEDSINSFRDAFKKFLKEEKLTQTYDEKLLMSEWESIIGKPIASRTLRMYVRENVLYVTLNSAPLKQKLIHHKEKVLTLIEEKFGKKIVSDIRFM